MKAPNTKIFSYLAGAGLRDTIGRYVYLFERLTTISAGRFYGFERMVSYILLGANGETLKKLDFEVHSV
ncbi:MAG TPA: hypothetical protein VF452_13630 [Candidatus Binatia bacterium]